MVPPTGNMDLFSGEQKSGFPDKSGKVHQLIATMCAIVVESDLI